MRSRKIIDTIFEFQDDVDDDYEWGLEKDEWGLKEEQLYN
jgi:hypothetical protein